MVSSLSDLSTYKAVIINHGYRQMVECDNELTRYSESFVYDLCLLDQGALGKISLFLFLYNHTNNIHQVFKYLINY